MNKHRLYRRSKKIQGRGFPTIIKEIVQPIIENSLVTDKIQEILNRKDLYIKKKKIGGGLKIYPK